MSTKSETGKSSALDVLLLAISLLVLAAGIAGFYYFDAQYITVVRMVGLLVAVAVSMLIAGRTEKGATLFRFFKEADIERRKVVWPSRAETMQTTLMVLVVTVIISIILFLIDTVLGKLIRLLIG